MDKMKKILFVICALLMVSCAGVFKKGSSEHKHFLWKVSDENSSVWVLGSIHFADSSFYPLDSVVETAFVNAEELAAEININDDSVSQDVAKKMLKQGVLPNGTTLDQVLPEGMWKTIDSLCLAWNYPPILLKRFRPWFAATTLSGIAFQRAGIDPNYGIDAVLLERAANEGKTIVGLETAEEQVNAVADTGTSDSAGIFYMKTTLREISELDSMVAQIIRAWKTGDVELMRKAMNEDEFVDEADSTVQKDFEERIYTSRNAKMAESIEEFLKDDRKVFVVVGAAHLTLDDDNVISLLQKKGFTVEQF